MTYSNTSCPNEPLISSAHLSRPSFHQDQNIFLYNCIVFGAREPYGAGKMFASIGMVAQNELVVAATASAAPTTRLIMQVCDTALFCPAVHLGPGRTIAQIAILIIWNCY